MGTMLNGLGQDYMDAEIGNGNKPNTIVPGGYVLRIFDARTEAVNGGTKIVLAFDVYEGEYKGYYTALHNYDIGFRKDAKWRGTYDLWYPTKGNGSQDDLEKYKRSMKSFKSAITAINDSNQQKIDPTQNFSTDMFKGKLIGGIFGDVEWEWDGKTGMATRCRWFRSVEAVRTGQFEIPDEKLLPTSNSINMYAPYTQPSAQYQQVYQNQQQGYQNQQYQQPRQPAQQSVPPQQTYQQPTLPGQGYNSRPQQIELGDLGEFEEILSDGDVPF